MPDSAVTQVAVRKRIWLAFFLLLMATVALAGRLVWIQIVQAGELYDQAWEQWNRSIPTRSPRGSIYDRHGRLLAGSTTVETVVAIPGRIEDPLRAAQLLSPVLEMETEKLLELLTLDYDLIYLKRKVEPELAQAVRALNIPGIVFTTEGQRYYPGYNLAAQLLGFVGMDQGWGGLELYYEDYLKGREGRIFFPSDARGRQLPHDVQRYVPPKEGLNLQLTIDANIQYIVERELARAMKEYLPDQAMIIAADPTTGAILAAASNPDFNPLHYGDYNSDYWALNPVTSSFEPGSTFKLATMAASIEEGQFNQNELFFCRGYAHVAGYQIGCWIAGRGHGSISYLQAMESSCNPAFVNLGQRLGKEKLFGYIRAFGFGQKTGIDFPGEGSGLVFDLSRVGALELATTTFGQGISVTPLQQIAAVSAMVNGGFLMRPYLVREIQDSAGEIVYQEEPEVVRQVVSRETSREIAEIMESVVVRGGGRKAAIEGFRIGGKTGTAQKVGPEGTYLPGQFIVSFIGFVPVDDPQFVLYVAVDFATRGTQWGALIGAPIARRVLLDVVNYLEIPSNRSALPHAELVEVPDLRGLTADEAAKMADVGALVLRAVGEGQAIVNQTPKAGALVAQQTQLVIYLGPEQIRDNSSVILPDLQGFTIREAGEILNWLGLRLEAVGSGIAARQLPAAGAELEYGAEVRVYFGSPLDP